MLQSFDTPGPTSLYVEIGSGDVQIRADDTAETTVEVTGEDAEDSTVEMRGEQIVVLGPHRRGGFLGRSHDLYVVVTMPVASRLTTKLGSADLDVTGSVGETRLKSGSGDIRLDRVASEAGVDTGSGDITVREITGDLRVRTASGDVAVERLGGSADVATASGDVEIGSAAGEVSVKTASGDLRIREARKDVSLATASGDLTVDLMGAGQLQARNVSGDIRVGIPAGLPVWTDVNSMSGSVHSTLAGAGQPEEGEDFLALRAKTVSGDISLEQR